MSQFIKENSKSIKILCVVVIIFLWAFSKREADGAGFEIGMGEVYNTYTDGICSGTYAIVFDAEVCAASLNMGGGMQKGSLKIWLCEKMGQRLKNGNLKMSVP